MKVLLCSHFFAPSVGGIETMSLILATEFARAGHEVVVATQSGGESNSDWPFRVLRSPGAGELMKAVTWADVVFHNNVCLRLAWPLAIKRKPLVITHQTWISRADGRIAMADLVKRWFVKRSHQIAISHALAEDVEGRATVIGNCYDDTKFRIIPDVERDRDLVFVGRVVSDKGLDILIDAIAKLRDMGVDTNLTVIGDGQDLPAIKEQVGKLRIADRVRFEGILTGEALVRAINRHRIMVIPSRWNEPFGIVALEGAACGCVLIGSDGGGLKDAIGPCGSVFKNGDLDGLTSELERVLNSPQLQQQMREGAPAHLAKHTPKRVAESYLQVLQEASR